MLNPQRIGGWGGGVGKLQSYITLLLELHCHNQRGLVVLMSLKQNMHVGTTLNTVNMT